MTLRLIFSDDPWPEPDKPEPFAQLCDFIDDDRLAALGSAKTGKLGAMCTAHGLPLPADPGRAAGMTLLCTYAAKRFEARMASQPELRRRLEDSSREAVLIEAALFVIGRLSAAIDAGLHERFHPADETACDDAVALLSR